VWKWGLDFDGTGTNPLKCELIDTFTVGGHGHRARRGGASSRYGPTSPVRQPRAGGHDGCPATRATAEGTITQTRYGSINSVLPGNGDRNEWSLGREFFVPPRTFCGSGSPQRGHGPQLHACYVCWDE
jgi:hypothetical protein